MINYKIKAFTSLVFFAVFAVSSSMAYADGTIHRSIKTEAVKFGSSSAQSEKISDAVIAISKKEKIDPILIAAIIAVESSFKPSAESSAGAIGLMQVVPRYHEKTMEKLSVDTDGLKTIDGSLKVGVYVFKSMLKKHQFDVQKALQSYNGTLSDKDRTYSKKVMKMYYKIKART